MDSPQHHDETADSFGASLEDERSLGAVEAPVRRPGPTSSVRQQLPTLDFLRNFLSQRGMTETLECFETEWDELVQKGQVDTKRVEPVPEVHAENQRLARELRHARREEVEYRRAASEAAEALLRVQRSRDAHRLQHQRLVQEKNRLIEEMKRLKQRCDSFQPVVRRMSEKYKAVSKQVLQVSLEGDKSPLEGDNQTVSSSQSVNKGNCSLK